MKNIKTVTQFNELFTTHAIKDTVYVFDEFDCVQGIIANRNNKEKSPDDQIECETEKARLRDQYMQTLNLKATATEQNRASIDEELQKITASIALLDDALTLDTLLTVLDGINEHRGRVIIATTNYLDRIDPALMRGGRFDLKISMDKFNSHETRELLNMMFKGTASTKDINYLNKVQIPDGKYTPVQIVALAQEYMDLRTVIKHINKN